MCIISKPSMNSNLSSSPEMLNLGQNCWLFVLCYLWNLMDDLEKQLGTSFTVCQALYIISKSWLNSNWSYSLEMLNLGQNWQFSCPMWPWNKTDDLEKQWGTSSILYQTFGIILKPSVDSNWSYSSKMLNLSQNWWFFVQCDFEIWVPLLYYIKHCASFQSHRWIQT